MTANPGSTQWEAPNLTDEATRAKRTGGTSALNGATTKDETRAAKIVNDVVDRTDQERATPTPTKSEGSGDAVDRYK
jgi:hypothetical protein